MDFEFDTKLLTPTGNFLQLFYILSTSASSDPDIRPYIEWIAGCSDDINIRHDVAQKSSRDFRAMGNDAHAPNT